MNPPSVAAITLKVRAGKETTMANLNGFDNSVQAFIMVHTTKTIWRK